MEIIKGITLINQAIYLENSLIISDIHIGYEEALNKQGILIPRLQFKDIIKNLDNIFSQLNNKKLGKIILNGDLKHEFGNISETEWRHTIKLLDYLGKKCEEIILIKGNHDTILGPIAKKRNVTVKESEIIKDTLILHGDKILKTIPKKTKAIIIGHEHPAVTLKQGPRSETYKCFLKGKFKSYNLIVQPSFHPLVEGTDILGGEFLSPFLKQNINNFNVYIIGDKVYDFGKLKNLKK